MDSLRAAGNRGGSGRRGCDDLGQRVGVPDREHLAFASELGGQLHLVIVDVLSKSPETRYDHRRVADRQRQHDAAHAGVSDNGLGALEVLKHRRESHIRTRPDGVVWRRATSVLDHEIFRSELRERFYQPLERLMMGADSDENQKTFPLYCMRRLRDT